MKVRQLRIENFRLLKSFTLDLEDELSLMIGKNNTGKTSVLSILDKFLNSSEKKLFTYNDFNIGFRTELKKIIEDTAETPAADYKPIGIKLRLLVDYNEKDNLSNISKIMMDLDPANNVVVLGFDYIIHHAEYLSLRKDYAAFIIKEKEKKRKKEKEWNRENLAEPGEKEGKKEEVKKIEYVMKTFHDYLGQNSGAYFTTQKKSIEYDMARKTINESKFIDLAKEGTSIKDLISFKFISAKREVTNKDFDKTLSSQTSRIYARAEESEERTEAVETFKERLNETDGDLSGIYQDLFKDVIEKVKDFGGIKINDTEIKIISSLQHRELLQDNTTVVYKHDKENSLPEHYNGLGYMNLISIIFEIEILVEEFKRSANEKPADINLLFIEEPEAHTHPQMQYVFIKNIKSLLKKGIKRADGLHRELQYIISTHSSCIVADSDFDDVKYLKNEGGQFVVARNLKDLKTTYDESQYHFLTQYLTISRAEIFFADKAVLIEGDTERILIPTFMRKIDIEEDLNSKKTGVPSISLPLLSQNISTIEVGAYSQIFEEFIEFLGIKTLIITDLDATDKEGEACRVSEGVGYSNSAISAFYSDATLEQLKKYKIGDKCLKRQKPKWIQDASGRLCVVYQTAEDGYNARSFEDGFIHINRKWVTDSKDIFKGVKNAKFFDDPKKDSYELADRCIKKKTHFALDIIYNSDANLTNWTIPIYIKEGLLWLKQD